MARYVEDCSPDEVGPRWEEFDDEYTPRAAVFGYAPARSELMGTVKGRFISAGFVPTAERIAKLFAMFDQGRALLPELAIIGPDVDPDTEQALVARLIGRVPCLIIGSTAPESGHWRGPESGYWRGPRVEDIRPGLDPYTFHCAISSVMAPPPEYDDE